MEINVGLFGHFFHLPKFFKQSIIIFKLPDNFVFKINCQAYNQLAVDFFGIVDFAVDMLSKINKGV